jgi:hypothetical protein
MCFDKPLETVDIFMDDYIALCQGGPHRRTTVRRILLHAIDSVLQSPQTHPKAKEPASLKKLRAGDGSWNTLKAVLGWLVDTLAQTLELPPHRQARIAALFREVLGRKRVSLLYWQKLLGELRFIAMGVPGARGLFSMLQLPLTTPNEHRIRITRPLRRLLRTYQALFNSLASRPTRLAELIPERPRVIGAMDASGLGAGGVYFTQGRAPTLWRTLFPSQVRERLVTRENPHGDLTNSDCEQAATVLHMDVMANELDLREVTVGSVSDNGATVSRYFKGSKTTAGPASSLCQLAALHQRYYRYCHELSFMAGKTNAMADDASRLFHLTDTELLSHFNSHYPQDVPWQMQAPRPKAVSCVTSALLRKFDSSQWLPAHAANTAPPGPAGCLSATPINYPTISWGSKTLDPSSRSSPSASDAESSTKTPAVSPSQLAQYLRTSRPCERKSSTWWGSRPPPPKTSNPATSLTTSRKCSLPLPEKILLQTESSRSTSPSCAPSLRSMCLPPTLPTSGAASSTWPSSASTTYSVPANTLTPPKTPEASPSAWIKSLS